MTINYEELEKLAKLKEQGILSDEEFNIEKNKLLNGEKTKLNNGNKTIENLNNNEVQTKSEYNGKGIMFLIIFLIILGTKIGNISNFDSLTIAEKLGESIGSTIILWGISIFIVFITKKFFSNLSEEKRNYNGFIVGLVVSVLLSIIFSLIQINGVNNSENNNSYNTLNDKKINLQEISTNLNKGLPITMEGGVRVDSVNVNNNTLNYNATFTDISKKDNDKDDIEIMQLLSKNAIIDMFINDNSAKKDAELFFNNGINISYAYRDKDNIFLFEVLITPNDYFDALKNN